MTTQTEPTKTTGNLTAVLSFIFGMLLIAAWLLDGMYSSGRAGIFGIIGVVAVILGIYFNGKAEPKR